MHRVAAIASDTALTLAAPYAGEDATGLLVRRDPPVLLGVSQGDASPVLTVTSGGNVGIGTTSPSQRLHVEGQCVTGDALLAIAKLEAENWKLDTIPIKETEAGLLVYSLNEETGTLEPRRIMGLLKRGVQPVFKLTTASGRWIKTTGNHPYLTRTGWRKVSDLQRGEEIVISSGMFGLSDADALAGTAQGRSTATRPPQWPRPLSSQTSQRSLRMGQSAKVIPMQKNMTVAATKSALIHAAGIFPHTPPSTLAMRKAWKSVNDVLERASSRFGLQNTVLVMTNPVSHVPEGVSSHGVDQVQADGGDVRWDPIASIESTGREPVYDIEVEGTHNFVANGILAHNTYMNGSVGIGTTSPAASLSVHSPPSTVGLLVKGAPGQTADLMQVRDAMDNGLWTMDSSGHVGIGTTSPGARLDVNGSVAFSSLKPAGVTNAHVSYFTADKTTAIGTTDVRDIYTIDPTGTRFAEGIIELTYGTRLQGISDSATGVVKKLFGYNKFNGGQVAVTASTVLAEDVASATHAPITAEVVGTGPSAYVVIRVTFSASLGSSSFTWGEIKIFEREGGVVITKLL